MVTNKLQFSFFFTSSDGSLCCSAYDAANDERLTYCIQPDGIVHQRSESFPNRGWKFLPAVESDAIREVAIRSQHLVPNYKA